MDSNLTISGGSLGRNIFLHAVHPDFGFVWTDGECVYLSSHTDSGLSVPSLNNSKTLGKFREVTGCSWSQCQMSGTHYLAVEHRTCAAVWSVEIGRESTRNSEFKKHHTIEHKELGRGCLWHPKKLLLVVFTKSQVVIYSIRNGESTILDNGLDITAACWTQDGHHLILADGNQLKIFRIDEECTSTTSMQSTLMKGNLGAVSTMSPISDDIIAIATELPLQKIVTELSADLFSTETSKKDFKEEDALSSPQSDVCENRSIFTDTLQQSRDSAFVCEPKLEAKVERGTSSATGSENGHLPMVEQGTDEVAVSQHSPSNSGCHSNSDVRGRQNDAGRMVEEALKEKRGPIDLMEILLKAKNVNMEDKAEDKIAVRKEKKPSVGSTDEGETQNPPKPTVGNGHNTRTCVYQIESCDERPHYHLIKGLKSENGAEWHDSIQSGARVGGKKIPDRQENLTASETESKMVDLTFLKSQSTTRIPTFKQQNKPGAGSSARLTLFDARTNKFLSHTNLHGIITPSLILYQANSKILFIGSHSSRTILLYTLKEAAIKRLPSVELGEAERPVGLCSLPDTEGSILVAVTQPISDDGSFRGVLPSSAHEERLLSLRIINLRLEQSTCRSSTDVIDTSSSRHGGSTYSPGIDDDDGLHTLLLPGGSALDANEESVGRRLGIEVLNEDIEVDAVPIDPSKVAALDMQSQPCHSSLYPTPENTAYVTFRIIKSGQVFHKSFLLHSNLLRLQPILDVFHLSQVEMKVGPHWIVITADNEGVIPLRFSAGSSYDVREATLDK